MLRLLLCSRRKNEGSNKTLTCNSVNFAMKLRFLLMSICVGEWSSTSLSFCSWPGRKQLRNNHRQKARKGREHTGSSLSQEPFSNTSSNCNSTRRDFVRILTPRQSQLNTHNTTFSSPWSETCFRNAAGTYFSHICALPHSTPCSGGSLWTASLQPPPAAGIPTQAEMLHWAKRERQQWTFKLKVLPISTSGWKKFPDSAWALDDSKGLPENACRVTTWNNVSVNAKAIKSVILANFVKKKIL